MEKIERIFTLNNTEPFDQLKIEEVINLSDVTTTIWFEEGELIVDAHKPVDKLYIVADGEVICPIREQRPKLLGVWSLLSGEAYDTNFRAGPDGALCLTIKKAFFLTTVYECPAIMVKLVEMMGKYGRYYW